MSDTIEQTPEPETTSRTPLLLAAVAAAAVVAGLLGYFVVLPMVSPDTAATTTTTAAAPAPATSATAAPTASPSPSAAAVPDEFTGKQGRDPFESQVSNAVPATGATSGTTTPAGTGTAAPTTPQRLDVLSVDAGSPPAVTVRLDTAVHVAAPGETIDGVLKVVSVTVKGECATFLFGEQSFRMCAKDAPRVLK
jgi:hypothetical protein